MNKVRLLNLIAIFYLLTFSGCATSIYPSLAYDPSVGSHVHKMPLKVSLYMTPGYKNYVGRSAYFSVGAILAQNKCEAGPALELFTAEYFKMTFDDVQILEYFPASPNTRTGDFIFVPYVKRLNQWSDPLLELQHFSSFKLEISVYNASLERVYVREVEHKGSSGGFVNKSSYGELMSSVIQHGLTEAINAFHDEFYFPRELTKKPNV